MRRVPDTGSTAIGASDAVVTDGFWIFPLRESAVTSRAGIVAGSVAFNLVMLVLLLAQSLVLIIGQPGSIAAWTPLPLLVLIAGQLVAWRSEPMTLRQYVLLAMVVLAAFAALTVAMSQSPAQASAGTAGFVLSVTTSVAVIAGTVADHWTGGVAGAIFGLLAVETTLAVTALAVGMPYRVDVPPIMLAAGLVVSYALFPLARSRARGATASLVAAEHRTRTRRLRELEGRESVAHLHDTLLGTLAALASREPGPLAPADRAMLERGLESTAILPVLRGTTADAPGAACEWIRAVADAGGVRIHLEGDTEAIDELPETTADALRRALEQCLVNVTRHAGVTEAFVSVTASDDRLSVTVVDEGVGFDPDAVPADRLGLSESIRGRIERLGGEVRVWSRPGAGTSVYLAVPRGS
ncbi:MAG TPA: ATP-binding protein [Protaetiibacter sp.]|nr:ATP-binding protein [Protaetiibacter sp.]